jgi:hypothetical protein
MMEAVPQTVPLDSKQLSAAIGVVAGVAQQFKMSPGERWRFRALMVLADGVLIGLVALVLTAIVLHEERSIWVLVVLVIAFAFCVLFALAALVLNLPLIWRTAVERRRLVRLGVLRLSQALWREHRRGHWIDRLRSLAILLVSAILILAAVMGVFGLAGGGVVLGCAGLMLTARHLRRLREQLDAATDADGLAHTLQRLRSQGDPGRVVEVPVELLNQVAGIESDQITEARDRALAQSVEARQRAWRVSFDEAATAQRSALAPPDRLALEDLVADLSADGLAAAEAGSPPPADAPAAPTAPDGATPAHRRFRRGGLQLAVVADAALRSIRVLAIEVTRPADPPTPSAGERHAA